MPSVADTFAHVADGYARLTRILSLGMDVLWRRRALARLSRLLGGRADGPRTVLDLATGTADFALAAARRFPSAHVTGLDLTSAMLEIGVRKVAASGLAERIALQAGDAAALPFADGAFDVALCAFGFRNFPDIPAALSEAACVLRDEGRLAVLEFFRPRSALLGAFTAGWVRCLAALFAKGRIAGYAYLRASIATTCSSDEFAAMARTAGFAVERTDFFLPACSCLVLRKSCGTPLANGVEFDRLHEQP